MKVNPVFLGFSCGLCTHVLRVHVPRRPMLLFQRCPPAPGGLNNLLPITPPSVWDFWWKREQQCQLLLLEWHFYIYRHTLWFTNPRAKSNSPISSCHSCCWQLSPVHPVVIHFQAVLCFSFMGQSCHKSLSEESARQLLHPKPRLLCLCTPLSHYDCVWLQLDFTPAAGGAARGCLHHHSQPSQNMSPLSLSWGAQGSSVG